MEHYTGHTVPFIFITSAADMETFRRAAITQPVAYLSKPYDRLMLQRAIEMAVFRVDNQPKVIKPERFAWHDTAATDAIFIKTDKRILKVRHNEIICLESEDKYTRVLIATPEKNIIVRLTVSELMDKLPAKQFVRISRKVVINLEHIIEMNLDENTVSVPDGTFQIGRSFRDDLLKKLRIVG